jgi:hypothetical protein
MKMSKLKTLLPGGLQSWRIRVPLEVPYEQKRAKRSVGRGLGKGSFDLGATVLHHRFLARILELRLVRRQVLVAATAAPFAQDPCSILSRTLSSPRRKLTLRMRLDFSSSAPRAAADCMRWRVAHSFERPCIKASFNGASSSSKTHSYRLMANASPPP